MKKLICLALSLVLLLSLCLPAAALEGDYSAIIHNAVKGQAGLLNLKEGTLLKSEEELPAGGSLSDWQAIVLAFAGQQDCYSDYLKRLESYVTETCSRQGFLSDKMATDYDRTALVVIALGGDPTAFGKGADGQPVNLLAGGIWDFPGGDIGKQGLNGVLYALYVLRASGAEIPPNAGITEQNIVDRLAAAQEPDGGFGLIPGTESADLTAMTLHALAPYREQAEVAAAVDRGLARLADSFDENGLMANEQGEDSSETLSQTILALCALGIDPRQWQGRNLIDTLLLTYRRDDGTFAHTSADPGNFMGTQQAVMALLALKKLDEGRNGLYDLSAYQVPEGKPSVNVAALAAGGVIAACLVVVAVIAFAGRKKGSKQDV